MLPCLSQLFINNGPVTAFFKYFILAMHEPGDATSSVLRPQVCHEHAVNLSEDLLLISHSPAEQAAY